MISPSALSGLAAVLVAGMLAWNAGDAQEGSGTGSLRGKVTVAAELPEPKTFQVARDKDVCGASHVSQEFIVSKETKGLKNVVFMLSGGGRQAGNPASIRLDQKGCTYAPHVQATSAGATLTVTNSDATFHNVHAYHVRGEFSRSTLFNIAQPAGSEAAEHEVVLEKTGVHEFRCDVHEWMSAYVVVHENAYFAVTDENGEYSIDGVPAGEYVLKVWHEGLGETEQAVTIEAGETVTRDFPIGEN